MSDYKVILSDEYIINPGTNMVLHEVRITVFIKIVIVRNLVLKMCFKIVFVS